MKGEKETTIQAYNKGAESLAAKFDTIGSRVEDIKRGLSFVQKENPKVLEIGCGNGRDALEIMKLTEDYQGIDASEEMVRLAKAKAPDSNFVVADMEDFEFPDNVDVIFAFASLLHADKDSIRKIIGRAHKSLSPDGVIYISVKYGEYHKEAVKGEWGDRIFYFYDEKDFADLAGKLYDMAYVERRTLHDVDWLTVVLKKDRSIIFLANF